MSKIERSHVVYRLRAKRAELLSFLTRLDRERHSALKSVAELDKTLALFTDAPRYLGRYFAKCTPRKAFFSFLFDFLRAHPRVSSREVSTAWLEFSGDGITKRAIASARERVSKTLRHLAKSGMIKAVGVDKNATIWIVTGRLPR